MGARITYGTAGATGGGWSSQPGTLQPAYEERTHIPRWNMQCRSPRTWQDKNRWYSLWSYGCRIGYGSPSGSDGVTTNRDLSTPDLFEPYSCDGEGTQSKNFLRGLCKDSTDTIVAGATVQAFVTATDAYAGEGVSLSDGTYYVGVEQSKGTPHYLVAYKAGSPDIAGTTVNTLLPTNVDGTS